MSNPSNVVVVSDRWDVARGELPGVAVSWASVINGIGIATLQVGYDHPKANEYYLGAANLARIRYPGLRPWAGRIDDHRWQAGTISVTLHSLETLVRKRRSAETRSFVGTAGGVCARALIDEANAIYPTGVLTDDDLIWHGGALQTFTCYFDDLFERIQKLATDVGAEWWIDEERYFHWQQRRGADKLDVILEDGVNVADGSSYSELSTEMTNDWIAVGYGEDWGQKPKRRAFDQTSIDRYGIREGTEDAQDLPTLAALDARAAALVSETGNPLRLFDLSVPNRDGVWSQLELGDRVRVRGTRWGWGGADELVRIIGVEVNEMAGIMRLTVQRGV